MMRATGKCRESRSDTRDHAFWVAQAQTGQPGLGRFSTGEWVVVAILLLAAVWNLAAEAGRPGAAVVWLALAVAYIVWRLKRQR